MDSDCRESCLFVGKSVRIGETEDLKLGNGSLRS